jgi:hypothetical protein
VALGLSLLAVPTAAYAGFIQYAIHYLTPESTPRYSAVATVRGGQAYSDSNLVRTYIQTLSGGVLLASAYANSGQTVTLSHQAYSGAQSRCYWDLVGSSTSSTVGLNCSRLA